MNQSTGVTTYFEEEFIMKIFIQTCCAIKHMHDRRIIHRDIKASNILLTHDYNVKVIDVGSSKILNRTGEQAKTCVGSK